MLKFIRLAILVIIIVLAGCSSANDASSIDRLKDASMLTEGQMTDKTIDQYEGELSRVISNIYTTSRKLALTFDGLPEREKLEAVLDDLERIDAKATFFVTGVRAAEEPELLQLIEQNGHEVQSLGLDRQDYNQITYQELYHGFLHAKQTIERGLGHELEYVRAAASEMTEMLPKAAAHTGHEALIGYNLFLKDSHLEENFKDANDLRMYIMRGGIVDIDLERNTRVTELLELLNKAVEEVDYRLVTVSDLFEEELEYKSYEEILPNDYVGLHPVTSQTSYTVIEHGDRAVKEVSLTIDDWGTDYTVNTMMDILLKNDVPATFFLRTNGVERNPSLARSILEAGFEVANHTYSHPVITTITDEEIQKEVVHSHRILTEALQQRPLMLFRPPTGSYDERSSKAVAATGYTTIANYDLTTLDWDVSNDAQSILNRVRDRLENGSVILIHILDDLHTIEALPQIIEMVREQGYTFVPMSKMVQDAQKK